MALKEVFTEMLQAEVWRKKLEVCGYRVIPDEWEHVWSAPLRESNEQVRLMHAPTLPPTPSRVHR